MSVTTINDQIVHYEAFGRGTPVIFIHGWLGSWRYWWPTMQAIANHHRSFAVDLWGFGDSSKSVGDYTVGSHVAMLDGFVRKMGIARPFALVGHSLGAAVALNYARSASGPVDRIAAIALPLSKEHVNGFLAGKSAKSVIDQSKKRFGSFPEVALGLDKTDIDAFGQTTNQLPQLASAEDLERVSCPVLLVYGAQDMLIRQPSGLSESDAQGPVDRQYVLLEECSHFPMLEQPAVFNRLLREFIDGAAPTTVEPKDYWQRRTR